MGFYEIFTNLCEERGVTPSAVAKAIGLTTANPTYWKRGSIPKGKTLQKLADYFVVSIDYLLGKEPLYKYGERIRSARQAAGLTQDQLATKCGVSVLTIQRFESSQLQPRLAQFRTLSVATNTPIQKLIGIPDWVDEKNIWETVDTLDQSGMTQDEIGEYLDQLEDVRSASDLLSDIELYEKVRAYVLDSLVSFTPEGLLRLVDAINELKKVPYYQRSAQSDEDEGEVKVAEDFQLMVEPSQFEKNVKFSPVQWDDIPHDEE